MANLRGNPAIEINVVDVFSRKSFRFQGFAEVISEGPRFDQALDFYRRRGGQRRINAAVLVRIERARTLVSPAYELGDSESEITARMKKYFDDLLAPRHLANTEVSRLRSACATDAATLPSGQLDTPGSSLISGPLRKFTFSAR